METNAAEALNAPNSQGIQWQLEKCREAITLTLEAYPNITTTMLSSKVRSNYGALWRDVLDVMIREGAVIEALGERPNNLGRFPTVFRLAETAA